MPRNVEVRGDDGERIQLTLEDGDFALVQVMKNLTKSIEALRNSWRSP